MLLNGTYEDVPSAVELRQQPSDQLGGLGLLIMAGGTGALSEMINDRAIAPPVVAG
jgi:hypothetical protein